MDSQLLRPQGDLALVVAWFRFGWQGQRPRMLGLLVGSGIVGLLQAAFGYLWKVVMEAAATGDARAAGFAMAAVGAAQCLLYVAVQGTRTWMNAHIQRVARDRVYGALVRARLDGWRVGDLVTRLTDDLSDEKLAWFLCSGVFRAVEALMVVGACLVAMMWISPSLTLWSLTPLPLLFWVHRTVGARVARTAEAAQRAISELGTLVHDVFTGIRVVQNSRLEPLAEQAFAKLAGVQREAEVRHTRAQQVFFAQFAYGWQLALAVLLVAGGLNIRSGVTPVADFAALSGFLMTLVFQVFDFGAFAVRGRQAATSLSRLQAVVDLPAVVSPPPSGDAVIWPASLRFGHITLNGDPGHVGPGRFVAVTGAVGTGKSTLLRAIAERDQVSAPQAAWVPQDAMLFSVTLGENVRLGVGPEIVSASVEAACLSEDVAGMPEGLATPVGERGVTLSGGQQQRLQIARALHANAALLLLDDATSALDPATEGRFWERLSARTDRPTVFAVTHRAATLARADEVIWLRRTDPAHSTLTRGTHATLLGDPDYARIYGNGTEALR